MKKITIFFLSLFMLSTKSWSTALETMRNSKFTTALTAGYVFKHSDCVFKQVYGTGMANAITIDGCYTPWESLGIGAKVSYWLVSGCTPFLKQHTFLQEVPITFYLRGLKDFQSGLRMYLSLGGGVVWLQEKNYKGHTHKYKGIGELEAGVNYPVWRCINFTSALRYLFPRQSLTTSRKSDIGGFDWRFGFGFSF